MGSMIRLETPMPPTIRSFPSLLFVLVIMAVALAPAASQAQERESGIRGFLDGLFGQEAPAPQTPDQPLNDPDTMRQQDAAPSTGAPQPGIAIPQSRDQIQLSFAPLVRQTAPSVVNVYASRMVQSRSPFAGDPFFERFFGQQFQNRPEQESSLGSGVVIDPSGIVITNNHVIDGADDIRIAFADGTEYASRVVLKDESVDLAVLRIEGGSGDFPALPFGDSDAVEVGDLVLAIGNPFGVGQTVTSGIVSALARNQVGVSDFGFFIQTDAAINPGNSGGALIDMAGNVVGINTAIYSRSGGSIGIGFAIPANMVRAVVSAAEAGGDRFVRPYIGATFDNVTGEIAEALGLPRASGALVSNVAEGGPAAEAGLQPGDVVTTLNGVSVEHPDALGYRLATTGIGNRAVLGVIARGETRQVEMVLAPPPEMAADAQLYIDSASPLAGALVADLTPALLDRLRLRTRARGSVVLEVDRGSPAARFGLRPGDVIISVNGTPIESAAMLGAVLERGAALWRFDIDRNGQIIRQFVR
jgi:Do/DeqQ family serine protease